MHTVKHHPKSNTGYQVCECGATRRVENGQPQGTWHSCVLCVGLNPHPHTQEG